MYSPLLALDEVGMLDWMSQFALPEAIIDELWPDLKHHVVGQEPCGARQISSMSHDSGFNLAAMVEQDLAG